MRDQGDDIATTLDRLPSWGFHPTPAWHDGRVTMACAPKKRLALDRVERGPVPGRDCLTNPVSAGSIVG